MSRHPFNALAACLLACLLACMPACTYWKSHDNVLVTSNPLGARILVDGEDTGKTTPARRNPPTTRLRVLLLEFGL